MEMLNHKVGFYGEFKLLINHSDGSTTDTGWMKNIITNIGLDQLGISSNDAITWCRFGTGTSIPNATNTNLDSQVASKSITSTTNAQSGSTITTTYKFDFDKGAVIGNITEMGVGWSDTGNTLWSRALVLDTDGNPAAITLTSLDRLTAFYRCSCIAQTDDITGSFNIGSTVYNYTGRVANLSSWNGNGTRFPTGNQFRISSYYCGAGGNNSVLGSINSSPSNTSFLGNSAISPIISPYVSGSRYLDNTLIFQTSVLNFSIGTPPVIGIKTVYVVSSTRSTQHQYQFDPLIPKDNTKTLSMIFRYSWDRL